MRGIAWFLFALLGAAVFVAGAAFLGFSLLAATLAPVLAPQLGLDDLQVETSAPEVDGVHLRHVVLRRGSLRLTASGVQIGYSWQSLRKRRLVSLHVGELRIEIDALGDDGGGSGEAAAFAPEQLAALPADTITVDHFELALIPVAVTLQGQMRFADRQLRLSAESDATPAIGVLPPLPALGAEANLDAEGRFELALSWRDAASPVVRVSGTAADSADGADDVQLRGTVELALGSRSLAVLSEMFETPLITGELQTSGPFTLDAGHVEYRGDIRYAGNVLDADLQLPSGEIEITGNEVTLAAERLHAQTEGISVSGRDNTVQLRADGSLVANSTLKIDLAMQDVPVFDGVEVRAMARPQGDVVAFDGRASYLDLSSEFAGRYGVLDGQLNVRAPFDYRVSGPVLARFLDWQQLYDLHAGRLRGELHLTYLNAPQIDVQVELTGGLLKYDDISATDVAASLDVRMSGETNGETNGETYRVTAEQVHVDVIDVGFPVTNVSGNAELAADTLTLSEFTGEMFGGAFVTTPLELDLENVSTAGRVVLREMDLAQILALEGEQIGGTGQLSGTVPFTLRGTDVRVSDALLEALPPGGDIRLSPALTRAAAQPGLDFALRALENFSYETLRANVNYHPDGEMTAAVRLEGSNPEIENGRAIHYNLNISENVLVLLRSLRIQDQVTRQVERRVRSSG